MSGIDATATKAPRVLERDIEVREPVAHGHLDERGIVREIEVVEHGGLRRLIDRQDGPVVLR
ncbi:hypothetical protein [Rathayibacter rathayi]|uniref:hypothetical protein n=1 Tax=Rathayibacter rathayi TaxID=33887 RepID=UPI0015E203C2|nr:hypothetical protein [Rathayibacter rathayi]